MACLSTSLKYAAVLVEVLRQDAQYSFENIEC